MMRQSDRLGLVMQQAQLANGLKIYYIPRPGFSKTFAMLATNFGSVDASFTLDGVRYDMPAGVAHFLEHKMFEDADGNALQKFGATGASPNAFTSHTMTAYHFSCTDRLADNLEILLKFVFTPYFTPENVRKEQGIIAQEIGMMEDTPDWAAYVGLFAGLYHEHPVRESIAGSVDSIARITPDVLLACHRAFYTPSNMCLVVCGTADFDALVQQAEALTPRTPAPTVVRHYGARRPEAARAVTERRMAVSQPTCLVGFKDAALAPGESRLRRQLLGDLAARILCGSTAPLFAALYADRLISRRFACSYAILPEAAAVSFGGESRDPAAVRDRLAAACRDYAARGVPEDLFARLKKACYGLNVRLLDQPDELCQAQAALSPAGECCLDFGAALEDITGADVQAMFARWAEPGRVSLSAVLPCTDEENA